jgi:hypothetical protein
MKRIDRVLEKLSDLYEFNRKLQAYDLKKKAAAPHSSHVAGSCRRR